MRNFFWVYSVVFAALSLVGLPALAQPIIDNTLSQRDILFALYNGATGASWTNNSGWLGDAGTECSWYGVGCNGQGQVTSLNLQENNLSGTLTDSIGQLSNLHNLNLSRNAIGGNVPATLGQLSLLNGLGLFNNNFTGTIPVELGQLSNLTYMDLGGNQLTGSIPSSFGNLGNLSSLYLYDNQLSGFIPSDLGQLGSLTILNLRGNQLTGYVPQSILDMNLTELSLSNNQFYIASQERAALVELYNATGGDNWINKTSWLGEPGTECTWFGVICHSGNVTALQLNNNNLVGTLPVALKDLRGGPAI